MLALGQMTTNILTAEIFLLIFYGCKNIFYLIKNNNSVFMSHNLSFDIFNTIVDNYKMLRMDYNG